MTVNSHIGGTPLEYWKLLRMHDWSYEMSDDHSVYLAGREQTRQLKEASELSTEHKRLWREFNEWWCASCEPPVPVPPLSPGDRVKLSRAGRAIHKHAKKAPPLEDWRGEVLRPQKSGPFVKVKWSHEHTSHMYSPHFVEPV